MEEKNTNEMRRKSSSVRTSWNVFSDPPQMEVISPAADCAELYTSIMCRLSPQQHPPFESSTTPPSFLPGFRPAGWVHHHSIMSLRPRLSQASSVFQRAAAKNTHSLSGQGQVDVDHRKMAESTQTPHTAYRTGSPLPPGLRPHHTSHPR